MSTHEKKTESAETAPVEDVTTQDRHTTDEPVETAPEPEEEQSDEGGIGTKDRHTTSEPAK